MPDMAYIYPIPYHLYTEHGIRRYGFHGTSHRYVTARAAQMLERDLTDLNFISCHLGNGASVAAVRGGRSIDTSMGLTPLEGLMMGTRSGDIDPALVGFLSRTLSLDLNGVEKILNKEVIWRGPKRVPARFEAPISSGMPTKQASSPLAVGCVGRRIMVAGPPKRGISLPPKG